MANYPKHLQHVKDYRKLTEQEALDRDTFKSLMDIMRQQIKIDVEKTDGDIARDWTVNPFLFYNEQEKIQSVGNYNYITDEFTFES